MNAIPRKHHSFIASGIVYSCCALVNNTYNELVIFPGIPFYSGNNSILSREQNNYMQCHSLQVHLVYLGAVIQCHVIIM